jgi:hypothetical protein
MLPGGTPSSDAALDLVICETVGSVQRAAI